LSLTVTQQRSANGGILRVASASGEAVKLHHGISDGSSELLRSSILQMSSSILVRRNQEESALRVAHAEAEAARSKLSSVLAFTSVVLQSSPLPICVYASSGQCVEANEAYAELFGIDRAELLQRNFRDLELWRTTGLLEIGMRALKNKSYESCEIHVVRSNGRSVFAECRILPTEINDERHLLIQFIDLTQRKRLEDELRQYAFHDSLTHLPNRRFLLDRMKHVLRVSQRKHDYFAVVFIDLNKFKQLNDTYGHDIGDQLLVQVANRLRIDVGDSDTVARLGGDEFVVLLERIGPDAQSALVQANLFAETVRLSLSVPYALGDIHYLGSASVGVILASDSDSDPDLVLKRADTAMYKEKTIGRDSEISGSHWIK